MAQQTTNNNIGYVNCNPVKVDQRYNVCLQKILGQNYQQNWRMCLTRGDGFCLLNSATDFLKKQAYGLKAEQLKKDLFSAFQQWKNDKRNNVLASALQQQGGIPKIINQINPNINDISYELIMLLPYPPFNMNYILIENVRLTPEAFIIFLHENQVNQRPFDDVYVLFSDWFKKKYKDRQQLKPMTKQTILKNIRNENDPKWNNSLQVNQNKQLIYTKQKLQQNFPDLLPKYKCETQMNTDTFNPDLPTLVFYLPGGHFSRMECNNVKVKAEFIRNQYDEKTGKKMSDEIFKKIIDAEKKRLNIFNNKMATNNSQNQLVSSPTSIKTQQQTVVSPISGQLDKYFKDSLVVIDGFLLGILNKDNKQIDIHNKEEAERLLSVFNNEYDMKKQKLSSATRAQLQKKQQTQSEILGALNLLEQRRIQQKVAIGQQKQRIQKQIQKLQKLVPPAYKNDIIPVSGLGQKTGSVSTPFSNITNLFRRNSAPKTTTITTTTPPAAAPVAQGKQATTQGKGQLIVIQDDVNKIATIQEKQQLISSLKAILDNNDNTQIRKLRLKYHPDKIKGKQYIFSLANRIIKQSQQQNKEFIKESLRLVQKKTITPQQNKQKTITPQQQQQTITPQQQQKRLLDSVRSIIFGDQQKEDLTGFIKEIQVADEFPINTFNKLITKYKPNQRISRIIDQLRILSKNKENAKLINQIYKIISPGSLFKLFPKPGSSSGSGQT